MPGALLETDWVIDLDIKGFSTTLITTWFSRRSRTTPTSGGSCSTCGDGSRRRCSGRTAAWSRGIAVVHRAAYVQLNINRPMSSAGLCAALACLA
jgi:hypothetical protein